MENRLPQLDGWRGISILLVLAGHLLPIGPKFLELNAAVAAAGMAIFFTLSGFLITSFLLRRPSVLDFLARRFFRIVPLTYAVVVIALFLVSAPANKYPPHLLFYANLPPFFLVDLTAHLWSICVEMQFYVGVAFLYAALGCRGLILIPLLAIFVTCIRVAEGMQFSIVTWYRIDEILAGGSLALAYHGRLGTAVRDLIGRPNPFVLLMIFLWSCHAYGGAFTYARPYLAAMLVGTTLFRPAGLLGSKGLRYVASISFALYILHPLLAHTWLGSGDVFERYMKRPVLFCALLLAAHLSTYQFEQRWITLGKKLSQPRKMTT